MQDVDHFPKSIIKAFRYIKQEAQREQLDEIKKVLDYAIKRRELTLEKITKS